MWMRRASWAHPHSRRENIVVSTPTIIRQGSSPLTRGKPRRGHRLAPQSRLIPAHAGKTVPARRPWPPARAHPHSRGENDWRVPSARHSCGSSPLTRGKPPMVSESKFMMGLIPAHAGKTDASPMRWNRHEAHPRSRGENVGISLPEVVDWGSSPLTRGKHPSQQPLTGPRGLIPAHAGKTRRWARPRRWSRAHPRSRGENRFSVSAGSTLAGSSPLTRGKRRRGRRCRRARRLIPAHAGKTEAHRPHRCTKRAHPRSRGENCKRCETMLRRLGSSPLTRGKLGDRKPAR